MTKASHEPGRMPGWIILIPVAIIVGLLTWFIRANVGR